MKRLALIVIAGTGAGALVGPARAAAQTLYAAPLVACHTGLTPADRSLEVDAVMKPVAGTVRMGLRFDVSMRTPQSWLFATVKGPGLGVWKRSHSNVAQYEIDKGVDNLQAPAGYRLRVGFRWYGPGGKILRTAFRRTRVCSEPDVRPNLLVKSVFVEPPTTDGQPWHYTVVVRNVGETDAGPFNVGYSAPGAPAQILPIAGLPAATQTRVTFTGAPCQTAYPPTFTADVSNQVDESAETDNLDTATC
jgi:hypothetical protein